jgi:dienelactone hydrolase
LQRRSNSSCAGIAFALIAALPTLANGAATSERVAIESVAAAGGARVTIDALLFKPQAPAPERGWPAIVGLHGCAGLYRDPDAPAPRLSARHARYAAELSADGYVVLLPDSFGARGVREMCTVKGREQSVPPALRRYDALAALAYLAGRHDVDRTRIAVLGWSHGGSTTLAAINAEDAVVAASGRDERGAFFRAAVAFYPGCAASLRAGSRWRAAVPTLIMIGELDDWTPAKPCVALGESAKARGDAIEVVVYASSHHGFDAPSGSLTRWTNVPNGVDPSGVTFGSNPEAAAASRMRLDEFLRERLAR